MQEQNTVWFVVLFLLLLSENARGGGSVQLDVLQCGVGEGALSARESRSK